MKFFSAVHDKDFCHIVCLALANKQRVSEASRSQRIMSTISR